MKLNKSEKEGDNDEVAKHCTNTHSHVKVKVKEMNQSKSELSENEKFLKQIYGQRSKHRDSTNVLTVQKSFFPNVPTVQISAVQLEESQKGSLNIL